MGCFPFFRSQIQDSKSTNKVDSATEGKSVASSLPQLSKTSSGKIKFSVDSKKETESPIDASTEHISAHTFTFRELAAATKNFRPQCLVGEGGFGRVYKGRLEATGQIVAVKQLDLNGIQGNREFLVEVLMLSLLHHPNLVNLIGYCADGDQRLLVYEYMALGSLEDHLHDLPSDKEHLDWNTRMKIAVGAARGLEYLHDKANPPVIYRDFKSSNILLDEEFNPKLSDFGLAKLGPMGDKTHVSTRVMGTYGYCAPEYAMTGQLTVKSDVYSFGVVLLELISGRKAIDNTRPSGEQNLVAWARPLFRDRRKFPMMADPMLQGRFPMRGLYQALAVAAMCLQEEAATRPITGDVVTALTYLASQIYDHGTHPIQSNRLAPPSPGRDKKEKKPNEVAGNQPVWQGGSRSLRLQVSPDKHSNDSAMPDLLYRAADLAQSRGGSGRRKAFLDWDENVLDGQGSPARLSRAGSKTSLSAEDRERAVAEARMWGEKCREMRKVNSVGHVDTGAT